ncbi:MAG: methyltransferase domain-containing protein [Verrucomicrobia bacterium]|nr:methyltransferase domain-containing protein [Verrucomicrobiota bacterium]
MDPAYWNQRFGAADYYYGTEPNDFVASVAHHLPPGPVLCLGEGEGRNAVFLAALGHDVLAVDQSDAGLAKARHLAASRGLPLRTEVADLAQFVIAPAAWSGVVATFVHLPVELRHTVHRAAVTGLQPGGCLVLELYHPDQVRHRTGGPVNNPELLVTLDALRAEIADLPVDFLVAKELEREVREGPGPHGLGSVVQLLARRR